MALQLHIPLHIVLGDKHLSVVAANARATASPKKAKPTPRSGGKPAGRSLSKVVKPHGKRAAFLRYFLARPRTVEDCMQHFTMSRPNVFGYWTAINKDHGIGYTLENSTITAILPPKHSAKTIFGV